MRTLFLATLLSVTGTAAAQSCGTLAITGTGAPGTTLTYAVTGATPRGYVTLAVAENAGTTTINLSGLGLNLTLGLDSPILPVPLGRANSSGDLTRAINVPANFPIQYALNAQGVTLTFTFMPFALNACTTNVVAFSIG